MKKRRQLRYIIKETRGMQNALQNDGSFGGVDPMSFTCEGSAWHHCRNLRLSYHLPLDTFIQPRTKVRP